MVLKSILSTNNYIVDQASNGDEALKLSIINNYDLFILDVQMPNMNGFELADNLKAKKLTKEIPIIFITAISKEYDFIIKEYEIGAIDYLRKPINTKLLLLKVNLFLELYHQKKYIKSINENLDKKIVFRKGQLNQRTEILEGIINNSNHGIALLSKEGIIIESNNFLLKIFEYKSKSKELIGLKFIDLIDDNQQSQFQSELNNLENNKEKSTNYNFRYKSDRNSKKWINIQAKFISLEEVGEYVLIVVDDIHEKLVKEEKVRVSETQKSGILSSIPSQIALLDKEGVIIDCNHSWAQATKSDSGDEVFKSKIGTNYLNVMKKASYTTKMLSLAYRGFSNVLSGKEKDFHMEYERSFGSIKKWFFLRVTPYGTHDGLVVTYTDITNRVRGLEKIRAKDKRLNEIINNISDAIFSVNADMKITSWSKACIKIYGYKPNEVIGECMFDFFDTEFLNSNKKEVRSTLSDTGQWNGEVLQHAKDGGPIFVNTNISTIVTSDKLTEGYAVLNKDITSKHKKDIELRNAIISGEEKERKRIASNLHDGLGQYLSALRMHMQVIKDNIELEKYENILSLIDSGISEYRSVSHNLIPPVLNKDGLDNALNFMVEKLNTASPIKITYKSNLNELKINDKIEIELYRIVQELVNNSLRHAEAKIINITLKNNKSKMLRIVVEDDGKGFDVKKLMASSIDGIGLSNIINRIHMLKGKIQIDSVVNKKTTISININL